MCDLTNMVVVVVPVDGEPVPPEEEPDAEPCELPLIVPAGGSVIAKNADGTLEIS